MVDVNALYFAKYIDFFQTQIIVKVVRVIYLGLLISI